MNLSDNIFNVLIVDDSNFFRVTARKMIEDNFHVRIFEASNAFEAMRLLGNHPIDIILLDVNMPEVDGFKAAKIIKHQEKYADIPIIFCTAMPPTKEVVHRSFDVGGIDFLNKPFTEAEKEWRRAEKENVKLIFYTDKNYPSRLKDINDAPSLLYTRGNIDFENPRTVGIVGTRKATPYGKERVDELVEGLLPHGALIVSGLPPKR